MSKSLPKPKPTQTSAPAASTPSARLTSLTSHLTQPSTSLGTLHLGPISIPIPPSLTPSRLPHLSPANTPSLSDSFTVDNLYFLLQKYLLGQDVFLVSQPGPYARRLVMAFCRLINTEFEHIALHRDVGETELKQGREIREGGTLVYTDSAAVRAAKYGRVLIIEGVEKAERGIMPVLNNLLENREINLDDGTHIIHPQRYELLQRELATSSSTPVTPTSQTVTFIPAHRNFRVIAIAAPIPPYKGYPLDPPFRSRFQARFVDPVGAMVALAENDSASAASDAKSESGDDADAGALVVSSPTGTAKINNSEGHGLGLTPAASKLYDALKSLILATQLASEESAKSGEVRVIGTKTALAPFPQTALAKLRRILKAFPPPPSSNLSVGPQYLARLILTLHPALLHSSFGAWASLSQQTESLGLGPLGSPAFGSEGEDAGSDAGLMGYRVVQIEKVKGEEGLAKITFVSSYASSYTITHLARTGPYPLAPFPLASSSTSSPHLLPTPRFLSLLTTLLQAHILTYDISLLPPLAPSTASCSTSLLVQTFSAVLGYELENVHMYKEIGGREVVMRRQLDRGGVTGWVASPLIEGAWSGHTVHLSGIDVIGATAGSISRLTQDREMELWEGKRLVSEADPQEITTDGLSTAHPAFRIITTASKSLPLKDWLTHEHANMFFTIPLHPMSASEESTILTRTGAPPTLIATLLTFAAKYRESLVSENDGGSEGAQKKRKLGTRALVRIARRVVEFPWEERELRVVLYRSVLAEFLPPVEKMNLDRILDECGIGAHVTKTNAAPATDSTSLIFTSHPSDPIVPTQTISIPLFKPSEDPEGVASHVPYMEHFHDNSLQSGLMRDMAADIEILGEHLVLLGNQGVGKNKIIDRLCQLLGRPREYIQLHRDTTVNSLMFQTSLDQGTLKHTDSPLLRAITHGRILIVDEADKAPEYVVAIFRSLGGHGELTLSDGRRVRMVKGREGDIVVHPNFRLILLANRPGYPFLGNHFLQVLGDNFSCHSVSNPDMDSERMLLQQLAPELDEETLKKLVAAFTDLRRGYEAGTLTYPYSLRELINLVKHLRTYPDDPLEVALRNVFDFDIYKPETIELLYTILEQRGLHVKRLGLEAARETQVKEVKFEPKNTELSEPKFGKTDPKNKEHHGGNQWAGGTGGRDTAGLGGRGGYMRLFSGHEIKQVSDELKKSVPSETVERAREMARQELARRLEELDMNSGDARGYGQLLTAVQAHIAQLHDLFENLSAKEEERVWIKRQTDGELDDTRLTEGLTGERAVYKRRGMEKPEIGRPQIKPKRIRFVFDISGSMYRFQYDGRLQRSQETAVMLMETFQRLSRKDKFNWDMVGHSGDSPSIPLVEANKPPTEVRDRWKVVEKMVAVTQYAFSGDYTVEAIEQAVDEVAKFDADDWFVIAITDANFGRYEITADDLKRSLYRNPKVHTALICIGEGAEATWIPKNFPGRAFRVGDTHDIPKVLGSILSTMVDS